MIVKSDNLYQVIVVVVVFLKVFSDDFLETIDDKLLPKRWGSILGNSELFVGFVVGHEFFHVEKSKTQP